MTGIGHPRKEDYEVAPAEWYPKQTSLSGVRHVPRQSPVGEWEREQVERTTGHTMLIPTLMEKNIRLRLALTQARDTLERYRDPLVREIDRVLAG